MKLKRLIPICSFASIAVLTPLITSCGGVSGSFSTTLNDDGTVKNEYEAKKEQKQPTHIPVDEMESTYFADIAEDNEILVDDFLYYKTRILVNTISANDEWKYSGKISASISISKFSAEDKTLSCKIKALVNTHDKNLDNKNDFVKWYMKISYVLKDIPIRYVFNYDAGKYLFDIDMDRLEDNETWSFKVDKTTRYTDSGGTNKDHESTTFDKDHYVYESLDWWFHDLVFESHYFANVTPQ